MDVRFGTPDLCLTCNSRANMTRQWGEGRAEVVSQHLQELEAAETLSDVVLFPHLRLTLDGLEGRGWLDGDGGVRLGIRWSIGDQPVDKQGLLNGVTAILVEQVTIDGEGAHAKKGC